MRGRRFHMAMALTTPVHVTDSPPDLSAGYFERRLAQILIAMYFCGAPANTLLEGETRQIESLARLEQFDFWLREPGHLALALLHARAASPEQFTGHDDMLRSAISRMLQSNEADTRRITTPLNFLDDFDESLSFLTSRALASDRPSFARGQTHQIILEPAGVELVRQILKECPSYDWYRAQAEMINNFLPVLRTYDLITLNYLAPDLTVASAVTRPLVPYIQRRFDKIFGVTPDVNV